MKLLVGLGNIGKEYENTRHNTGFLVMDAIAKELNETFKTSKFNAKIIKTTYKDEQIILMKPSTYMNNSGEAVSAAVNFYQLDPTKDVIIFYDDLDLPYGALRLREKGSSGGHNGIKSIIQHLKTQEFKRVRIGIDKNPLIPVVDYVLGKVEKENQEAWLNAIDRASKLALESVFLPFQEVMNKYNKA